MADEADALRATIAELKRLVELLEKSHHEMFMARINELQNYFRWRTIARDGRPNDDDWVLCYAEEGGPMSWTTNGKSLVSTELFYLVLPEVPRDQVTG